jgi:Permuted papain-like amidase enzyme, YaeF/YiiX, C92 family
MATGKCTKPSTELAVWLAATVLVLIGCSQHSDPPSTPLEATNYDRLVEDGDLVFRRQSGFISTMARNLSTTDKRFSHVGIIVNATTEPAVIHSVSDEEKGFNGVVLENLASFLEHSQDWQVFRIGEPLAARSTLARTATSYYSNSSDFDDEFDLTTANRLYCTELVWRVIREVFPDALHDPVTTVAGKSYIPLDQLYLNSAFRPVPATSP